ncbi:hypothetical protein [Skermanella pratensis]|uniref:hypothetical protein n=1 Tax=Skermanella pratensis TaxID=2233999 RepID=UPI001300D502|nr:hypothetical protein [Skermanella pratensis]
MTGAGIWMPRWGIGAALAVSVALGPAALAHNNPQIKETLLQTVTVEAAAEPASSEPFDLSPPPRTVEMVWKIEGDKADAVRFSVEADGKTVATDVHHGKVTPRIKAGQYRLVDITGASAPLKIGVFANVMEKK